MTSPTRDVFQLELEKRGVVQAVESVTGGVDFPDYFKPTPWADYKCHLRCDQAVGSGSPVDSSGNGGHGFLRVGYTDNGTGPWSNPGYLTTKNGSDQYAMLPSDVARIDLSNTSLIFSAVINLAAPASEIYSLITMGASTAQGWYIGITTSGVAKLNYRDASAATVVGTTVSVVADETDHTLGLAIDHVTRDIYLFVDGKLDRLFDSKIPLASVITMPLSHRAGIGGPCNAVDTATNGSAALLKVKGLHLIHSRAGLPLNLQDIMMRMHRNPLDAVPGVAVVPRRTAPRQLIVFGQSNELGAGVVIDRTTSFGPPYNDALTYPSVNTTKRSMWPRLMERMARERGIWVKPFTAAQGGTSIVESFVGNVREFASGMWCSKGSYVISDGGIWRDNVAGGGIHQVTNAPTGTSNVTGADNVPWVYIRPAAPADAGVQTEGSDLFDPLGYIAAGAAGLTSRVGFGERWVLIQFGQNDGGIPTTRADYSSGHISLANYFLARGCKIAIGLSLYSTELSIEANYQANLIPAISDVLTHYSGNQSVISAANLRNALGVLTKNGIRGVIELQTDGYHGTDSAFKAMSDAEFDALVASGRW